MVVTWWIVAFLRSAMSYILGSMVVKLHIAHIFAFESCILDPASCEISYTCMISVVVNVEVDVTAHAQILQIASSLSFAQDFMTDDHSPMMIQFTYS